MAFLRLRERRKRLSPDLLHALSSRGKVSMFMRVSTDQNRRVNNLPIATSQAGKSERVTTKLLSRVQQLHLHGHQSSDLPVRTTGPIKVLQEHIAPERGRHRKPGEEILQEGEFAGRIIAVNQEWKLGNQFSLREIQKIITGTGHLAVASAATGLLRNRVKR